MLCGCTHVAVSSSLDHDQQLGQDQSTSTEKLVNCNCYVNIYIAGKLMRSAKL